MIWGHKTNRGHKMKKLWIILVLIFAIFPTAFAEDFEIRGEDGYNRKVGEILSGKLNLNPTDIINGFLSEIFSELSETKNAVKSILLISVISGLVRALADSLGGDAARAAGFACTLAITGAALKTFTEIAGCGAEIIHALCDFITKLEPVLIGFLISSGAVTQAAAFRPVLSASVYVLTLLIDKFILPLAYFSAITGIVGGVGGRIEINSLCSLIKSLSKQVLTAALTLFSGILALYGIGTGSFNALASRGIKFAVGNLVPVVGGLLSDSAEAVLSGARLMKNAVGTAGMLTVIAMTAAPVIKIWVMMFLLRITAAATEPFSDKCVTAILQSAAEGVGTVFSAVITSATLFIVSIGIILTSTGVGL